MKRNRSKNYSLFITALIIIFLVFTVAFFFSILDNYIAFAQEDQEILLDGYEFSDNSVLVTLDKDIGGVNKIHNKNYFGDIAISTITDLTYRENVKNVDLDRFKQILKVELQYHDKNYVLQAVEKISKLKGVEAVTPNYFGEFCAIADDTFYDRQWGLKGDNSINIEPAWDITTGSKDVRVGVIDSGIAQHPDLIDNLAVGRSFVEGNSSTEDIHHHGTHVAGIIGAVGDNDEGITGVCKSVELVPLKISDNGSFSTENVIRAITYANELWGTEDQIDLLNLSGWNFPNNINLYNAINTYSGLFVTIAGNNGTNIDSKPNYPASFKCNNMITVGAINSNGQRWSSSNYGENTVDIYAPGDQIYSTVPFSYNSTGYSYMSGTSMAAPHVTGVAALLLSKYPTLTAAELKEIILNNADDIEINTPDGTQKVKKLNAYTALQRLYYEVTFEQEGFSGPEPLRLKYGDSWPRITMPTRQGYFIFRYYYIDENGVEFPYYDRYGQPLYGTFTFRKNITLVGRWSAETYTVIKSRIHFNADIAQIDDYVDVHFDQKYTFTADSTMTVYSESRRKNITRPFTYWRIILGGESDFNANTNPWITFSTDLTITFTLNEIVEKYYPNFTDRRFIELRACYVDEPIDDGKCIAEGTLITLADGKQVPVERLKGDEMLLVWNLFTGTFDTAPILFIDYDPAAMYEVINLYFSDGTQVKVISEHAFWDFDLSAYVYLDNNAAEYIGHWFNKQTADANGELSWTKVQLTDVIIQEEYTTAWSPVTYGHLCYYVNGMLSIPGGIEGLFNIFEVDGETMTYNAEAMAEDIAQYGLFTYEEFAELLPIAEEIFNAFSGQYLKVAIGKGLIDFETLTRLVERYRQFF